MRSIKAKKPLFENKTVTNIGLWLTRKKDTACLYREKATFEGKKIKIDRAEKSTVFLNQYFRKS